MKLDIIRKVKIKGKSGKTYIRLVKITGIEFGKVIIGKETQIKCTITLRFTRELNSDIQENIKTDTKNKIKWA